MSKRILIIEDDTEVVEVIKGNIESLGFEHNWVDDGAKGVQEALENDYILAVVDVGLPSMDGFEICRRVREAKSKLPILILSARGEEVDRVLGLELGADDYLAKPFSARELRARIRALLRRSEMHEGIEGVDPHDEDIIFQNDEFMIDEGERKLVKSGEEIELTRMQFDMLAFLASNPKRVFTREQIVERVWGYNASGYEDNVTTFMRHLREKIEENPSKPKYLLTVRGVGYKFDPGE